jgi:hypothetical protein
MSGQMTRLAARAHQDMLLREAPGNALPDSTRDGTLRPRTQILLHLGDLLISTGSRLRQRYEPSLHCCPETRPSAAGKARA